MKNILSFFILAGSIYFILLILLYIFQYRMIFFPEKNLIASPADINLKYEDVYLTTEDFIRIHGWFIPKENTNDVILFFHGNAGNISHRLESIMVFYQLGFSILIIDYRGFGKSKGEISEQGTYYDGQAAWNYLISTKEYKSNNIFIFGRSLGGAIASNIATRNNPGALILESTFTSVPDMAAELYPIFPGRYLSKLNYNNLINVKKIHCPVLIIHSQNDDIIPFYHGREIYASANKPKMFLKISGDHNSGFILSKDLYMIGIKNFIKKLKEKGTTESKSPIEN